MTGALCAFRPDDERERIRRRHGALDFQTRAAMRDIADRAFNPGRESARNRTSLEGAMALIFSALVHGAISTSHLLGIR